MNEKLYIVIPAYNEELNIENTILQWYPVVESISSSSRLLIVDDGSSDRTFEILQSFTETHEQLISVTKPNSGHGSTCLLAYNMAISENADFIFQTDSDGQTDPAEFQPFWINRNNFDFLIGMRHKRQDGYIRVMISFILQTMMLILFGKWIKDPNTPFRLMKTERLIRILSYIPKDFFLCNVAISVIAVYKKEKCKWYPISFKERQGGKNSINFMRVFKIGYKSIDEFRHIKKIISKMNNESRD